MRGAGWPASQRKWSLPECQCSRCGENDEPVDRRYSRAYADAASAELAVLPGAGHVDVIDPAHPSWKVAREWITARPPLTGFPVAHLAGRADDRGKL